MASNEKSPSAFAPGHIASPPPPQAYAAPANVGAPAPAGEVQHMPPPQPYVENSAPPAQDQMQMERNKSDVEGQERMQKGEWQHGFWDCFSPAGLCFKSCCCTCFAYGKTQTRLQDPSLQSYKSINEPCTIWGALQCFVGAGWVFTALKRGEMREAYGIEGSMGWDLLASCCCLCCVTMQMDKEVVSRQAQGAAQSAQGYSAPAPMVAPGQH